MKNGLIKIATVVAMTAAMISWAGLPNAHAETMNGTAKVELASFGPSADDGRIHLHRSSGSFVQQPYSHVCPCPEMSPAPKGCDVSLSDVSLPVTIENGICDFPPGQFTG